MAKSTVAVLITVLVLVAAAAILLFGLPFLSAASAMPEDASLAIVALGDGRYNASWTPAADADGYRVEVYAPDEDEKGTVCLLRSSTETNVCTLEGLTEHTPLRLVVRSTRQYEVLGRTMHRPGKSPLQADITLDPLPTDTLHWQASAEDATVTLSWRAPSLSDRTLSYEVCMLDYENNRFAPLQLVQSTEHTIRFGDGKDLPLPEYDRPLVLALRTVRQDGALTQYGILTEQISVTRDNLLGSELHLSCSSTDPNCYTLSWNETRGQRYRLEQWDRQSENWSLLAELPHSSGVLSYETGRLPSCRELRFRISALGGEGLADDAPAAAPAEYTLLTDASPLYATIWPLKALPVLAQPENGAKTLDTAPAAVALCILGEEDGWFLVQTEKARGYISSDFCLINLPDYVGDLCAYAITNSYSSRFMVHEYNIPEVTGEIVAGYEHIELEDGRQLAPLLYPTANRLMEAARAARADGYRLKIYDAYRPNRATRDIYSRALAIIDKPLPARTVSGEPVTLPAASGSAALTYRALLSNERFTLGNFLATSGSNHNMGIALDLTLERADTGEELDMQTSMHDLSWYSSLYENNQNANLLSKYMLDAGFGGLTSEWWHFQDNELRTRLSLNIYLYPGLSAEGWIMDDNGWRYRTADGSWLHSCTQTINGQSVSFDAAGYADRP